MKYEEQIIKCKKCPLTYKLVIKNVKNINLRMDANGELMVSANAFVPLEKIDAFVASKVSWIQKTQEKLKQRNAAAVMRDDKIMLFGRAYKLHVVKGKYNKVTYDDETVHVMLKDGADQEKVLQDFLNKLSKDIFYDIAEITHQKLKDYRMTFPEIKIRNMKSRWGSCTPMKNQITLNRHLIHYPIEFIEYVILHEFVHFIQPNHSSSFYQIIMYYMPDYKQRIALAG